MSTFVHPGVLFALVTILHFLIGAIDYSLFSSNLMDYPTFGLILLVATLGLATGHFVSRVVPVSKLPQPFDHTRLRRTSWAILGLSVAVSALYLAQSGIAIVGGFDARFARNPAAINVIHLGIPFLVFLFFYEFWFARKTSWTLWAGALVYTLALLALGYRTPIVVLVLSVSLCWIYTQVFLFSRRFSLKQAGISMLIVVALLYFVSSVAVYRIQQEYDVEAYYHQIAWANVPVGAQFIIPVFATLRADYIHLEMLLNGVSHIGHYPGQFLISDFITWLPGTQLGSRNMVGAVVSNRELPSGIPMSITVSLHGILFADLGFGGVGMFFFLAGYALNRMLRQARKSGPYLIPILAFILANLLKSVHSGYLDFSFYFQIAVLIIVVLVCRKRRTRGYSAVVIR